MRKAERVAAYGAMAVGSVALHEHHKRVSTRLSASVMGAGPAPGCAGAAMFEMQRRTADPLDSRPLLARSKQSPTAQRRRRELGW
jgi:hypothetical protein